MNPANGNSIELALTNVLEAMLLPPGFFCTLFLLALILRKKKASSLILFLGVVGLYLSSILATVSWIGNLQPFYPVFPVADHDSQAIVVIGGGRYIDTPEYDGDTVNQLTLERIRYAARLQKQTGLPILVSGGKPLWGTTSEAKLMHKVLTQEFGAKVPWAEANSHTTFENAQFSAHILKANGIQNIALVTHSYHMPRAMEAFQFSGLSVTPAPTLFINRKAVFPSYTRWIPGRTAAYWNSILVHEMVGRFWYHIRHYRKVSG